MAKKYPNMDVKEKKSKRDPVTQQERITVKISTKYYCGHTLSESSAKRDSETAAYREARDLLDSAIARHKIKCKAKIEAYDQAIREKNKEKGWL